MAKKYNFTHLQSLEFPRIEHQYQTYLSLSDIKKPLFLGRLEKGRQALIKARWGLDELEIERELPRILERAEEYRLELLDKTYSLSYGLSPT